MTAQQETAAVSAAASTEELERLRYYRSELQRNLRTARGECRENIAFQLAAVEQQLAGREA